MPVHWPTCLFTEAWTMLMSLSDAKTVVSSAKLTKRISGLRINACHWYSKEKVLGLTLGQSHPGKSWFTQFSRFYIKEHITNAKLCTFLQIYKRKCPTVSKCFWKSVKIVVLDREAPMLQAPDVASKTQLMLQDRMRLTALENNWLNRYYDQRTS